VLFRSDYHFDTISAFIKSVRGSDPDAALYWLARMVLAGEDPHYIFRRMLILASEDVGMADPSGIPTRSNAAAADSTNTSAWDSPRRHGCDSP
jgi:putative ATPase